MGDVEILEELRAIKEEIAYIKEHMVDVDYFLTREEETVLKKAIGEHEKGNTITLSDLERDD